MQSRSADIQGSEPDRMWMEPVRLRCAGLLVCCLLALGCGLLRAQEPGKEAALRARAEEAFASKDYRAAADLFARLASDSSAPEVASGRASALLMQAKSLINLGQIRDAEAPLQGAIQLKPNEAESLYLLGYVLQREDKPAASLQAFTRAAAITPPLANDLKLVALDYVLLDDYTDAVHWLTRSVQADPHNAEAWYDLGRAQMHQGRFPEAITAFRRSLAIAPGNPKALDNLGLSLEAQNKPAEALETYAAGQRAGEASHAPDAHLLLDYATLLDNRGAYVTARPLLEQAAVLAPQDAQVWEEAGRCALGGGRPEDARAALEKASTLEPGNAGVHFQLARVYRSLGRRDLAAVEFKRSAALYAKSGSAAPQSQDNK